MRKVILVLASVFALNAANAQTGKNQVGIAFEVGLPMGDFKDGVKTGFGGSLKYLHGVGSAGQVTLTSGYTMFNAKDVPSGYTVKASIIPILLGYRHNFSGAYVEPQVGYGIYGSKFKGGGIDESSSDGAFTWAIGVGYAMEQGLDLGARYQSASKNGSTTSLIGLHIGYNFSLGGASSSSK
jgi:hypothetical protein